MAAAGSGAAVGLLLGGVLVESVSVAAVFWFMFAVAGALLLAVVAFVPESPPRDSPRPDWVGAVLLTTALLALLLAISQGNTWGWGSARVVTLIALSAALFAGFVVVERAASAPPRRRAAPGPASGVEREPCLVRDGVRPVPRRSRRAADCATSRGVSTVWQHLRRVALITGPAAHCSTHSTSWGLRFVVTAVAPAVARGEPGTYPHGEFRDARLGGVEGQSYAVIGG